MACAERKTVTRIIPAQPCGKGAGFEARTRSGLHYDGLYQSELRGRRSGRRRRIPVTAWRWPVARYEGWQSRDRVVRVGCWRARFAPSVQILRDPVRVVT